MSDFAELGLESLNKYADKYLDHHYDSVNKRLPSKKGRRDRGYENEADRGINGDEMNGPRGYPRPSPDRDYDSASDDSYDERPRRRQTRRDERYDRAPPPQYGESPTGYATRDRDRDYDPQQQYQPYRPHSSGYNDPSPRHSSDYAPRAGPTNAMAPYNAQQQRPVTRNRDRDRDRDRRSKSHDARRHGSSRSTSHTRDPNDNPLLAFDRSELGLGAGLAGALVGGYLGRETSDRHQGRATALGAILGGIGANLVENRIRIYREEKKDEAKAQKAAWAAKHGRERDGRDSRERDGRGGGERDDRDRRTRRDSPPR